MNDLILKIIDKINNQWILGFLSVLLVFGLYSSPLISLISKLNIFKDKQLQERLIKSTQNIKALNKEISKLTKINTQLKDENLSHTKVTLQLQTQLSQEQLLIQGLLNKNNLLEKKSQQLFIILGDIKNDLYLLINYVRIFRNAHPNVEKYCSDIEKSLSKIIDNLQSVK